MTGKGLQAAVGDQIVEDRPSLVEGVAMVMVLVVELQAQEGAVTLGEEILEEGVVEVLPITMALQQQLNRLTLFR